MSHLIYTRAHHYVDHIALGVNDTRAGMKYIEDLTGAKAYIPEGQQDQWYRSAALGLGAGCYLEIIGPNPEYKKFHPFKQILKDLTTPKLFFWYLGTHKFKECRAVIEENDFQIEQYNHIQKEIDDQLLDYEIAVIGQNGFESERPCLIQWNHFPKKRKKIEHICQLKSFSVTSDHDSLQSLFDVLDVKMKVLKGEPSMHLVIDSPKGEIVLEGGGFTFPNGLQKLIYGISLYGRHLFGRS